MERAVKTLLVLASISLAVAAVYEVYGLRLAWSIAWLSSLLLAAVATLQVVVTMLKSLNRPKRRIEIESEEYKGLIYEVEEVLSKGHEPSPKELKKRIFQGA
ncbi:hypothetical protein [Infirmifilum sp. SLHALR2]|nr:MAG: hypothetical protein B7L53_07180 [Thermofilum sp. NZ13]